MNIGKRIRAARKGAGLTQMELAVRMGSSITSISHWEAGRMEPRALTLKRLSAELGVCPRWLLGLDDDLAPRTEERG